MARYQHFVTNVLVKLPGCRETVGSSSLGLDVPPPRVSHSVSLHTRAQSMQSLDHYDLPPAPKPPPPLICNSVTAKDRLACLDLKSKISMPEEMYHPAPEPRESHPRCVESVIVGSDSSRGGNDFFATKQGLYRPPSIDQPSGLLAQVSLDQNSLSEYQHRSSKSCKQSCGYRSQSTDQQNLEFCPGISEHPGIYRTMSRATLIDQDSGNVYQVRLMDFKCIQF